MLLREYVTPDYLVVCFFLAAFALMLIVVREFTRKRKSSGKKRELQRPFIKRRSPSPKRSRANVLTKSSPTNRQQELLKINPHVSSGNANGQLSGIAPVREGVSPQSGILGQVMASISPPTLSDALGKLPAFPRNHSYPMEVPHRRKSNKSRSSTTSLPADGRQIDSLSGESVVEESRPNVKPKAVMKKTSTTPQIPSPTVSFRATALIADSQAQGNSPEDKNNLYEENKRASLLQPKVQHSEVHGMEMQLQKSNQVKLKELQFCDVKDPFRFWVHDCPIRKSSAVLHIWGHKCFSDCLSSSFGEKHKSNNDDGPNQDRQVRENGRNNSSGQDAKFGRARRPRSFCGTGNTTISGLKARESEPHSQQCEMDHFQEGKCDIHCSQCSPQKPRSCDDLSPRNCEGIACEHKLKTSSFHGKCDKKTHQAHNNCKHEEGKYHCLKISVSPKRYYSLGSLCDVSICGQLHFDMSVEDNLERNENSSSSRSSAECGSYNDTGYTSTDEMDTFSTVKMNLDTGSYDGDSEYDSEEGRLANILTFSDEMVVRPQLSVSELYPIGEYAKAEWKSETTAAQAIRKGYSMIPSHVGCHHLRRVRGDNYCAIRAALFQALANNVPLLSNFPSREDVLEIPRKLASAGYTCLDEWTFAGRMTVPQLEVLSTLEDFLGCLVDTIAKVEGFETKEERVDHVLAVFNEESGESELKLFEAVKLLMFHRAVDFHEAVANGGDVPVFAHLLFARDASENPQQLLRSYLNHVGDSGGLEQVEMCLLGYSLGLVIQVIRPSQVDQDDFLAYFPSLEDVPKYSPTVTLIAEDDRHYNIAA